MADLIDRQAAIDAIGSYISSFTAIDRNYYEGLRDAKRLLNDIPSAEPEQICVAKVTLTDEQVKEAFEKAKGEILTVLDAQPERKKGKWIERWHDNKHIIGDMACSVCGAQMLLTFPRFCPCCGAYMREEEQDDKKAGCD